MRRNLSFLICSLISIFAFVGTNVRADNLLAPDSIEITTPTYHPDFTEFDPKLGKYTYRVSWQGIPAAELVVDVKEEGLKYHVTTTARTFNPIDLFYTLRYRAEGIFSAIDLQPERMTVEHRENSRIKNIDLNFRDDGTINSVYSFRGRESEVYNFNPKNFTLDPFSAAFMARSLDWKLGDVKTFDCFNGKSRYLITLTAADRVRTFVNGENRDVWIITPRVDKLTEPEASKKLREAKIYVSADKSRDILQIVSEVFVGSVTTRMVSFVPSEAPSVRAQLVDARAQLK